MQAKDFANIILDYKKRVLPEMEEPFMYCFEINFDLFDNYNFLINKTISYLQSYSI